MPDLDRVCIGRILGVAGADDTDANIGEVKEEDTCRSDSVERTPGDTPSIGLWPWTEGEEEPIIINRHGLEGLEDVGTLEGEDSKDKEGLEGTGIEDEEDPIVGRGETRHTKSGVWSSGGKGETQNVFMIKDRSLGHMRKRVT